MPDTDIHVDVTLDASGMLCPMPIYKASLALKKMADGEVLELIATDPGSPADVEAMARQRGDTLLRVDEGEGRWTFYIRKGGQSTTTSEPSPA